MTNNLLKISTTNHISTLKNNCTLIITLFFTCITLTISAINSGFKIESARDNFINSTIKNLLHISPAEYSSHISIITKGPEENENWEIKIKGNDWCNLTKRTSINEKSYENLKCHDVIPESDTSSILLSTLTENLCLSEKDRRIYEIRKPEVCGEDDYKVEEVYFRTRDGFLPGGAIFRMYSQRMLGNTHKAKHPYLHMASYSINFTEDHYVYFQEKDYSGLSESRFDYITSGLKYVCEDGKHAVYCDYMKLTELEKATSIKDFSLPFVGISVRVSYAVFFITLLILFLKAGTRSSLNIALKDPASGLEQPWYLLDYSGSSKAIQTTTWLYSIALSLPVCILLSSIWIVYEFVNYYLFEDNRTIDINIFLLALMLVALVVVFYTTRKSSNLTDDIRKLREERIRLLEQL